MRKVSRNVKVQLEQAVDNALQKGNHHGWALIMMVFSPWRVKVWNPFSSCWLPFSGCGDLATAGGDAGAGNGRGAGFPALLGWHSPEPGAFFKWTSLFILLVAAGLAAGAIRAFHEAGLWNHFRMWRSILAMFFLPIH